MTHITFPDLLVINPTKYCESLIDPDFVCPEGSERRDEHPFNGRCTCDQQLWVSEECKEGYWCFDNSGAGCYKVLQFGSLLIPFCKFIND